MLNDQIELKEKCGVFGIYEAEDAAKLAVLGLHALQHRGQEGAGIVCHNEVSFNSFYANGHVGDNYNKPEIINSLKGNTAIGHVRYSTSGSKQTTCTQPLLVNLDVGNFSLAHNGNLTNAETLKKELVKQGCIFQTSMDTEVFMHLIARDKSKDFITRFTNALKIVKGAFSLVALDKDNLYAVRDANGVRPLVLGKVNDSFVVASETCALDIIGAKYVRDIEAGEMVIINKDGIKSLKIFDNEPSKFCIFEYVYFARPDSTLGNVHVYEARKNIGQELAKESSVQADLIVPVPDSGVPAAMGYAKQSGIDFELGIIRNHYVGRTFIEPTDNVRHLGVKLKHNANGALLKGKKVILVDDSIVRGTTSKKIVQMVRDAGAAEVHMRIASPPTINSCYYGVDTPEREKLMAYNYSVQEMAKLINADSLSFITIDGLYRALGHKSRDNKESQFCDACFTSDYPIEVVDKI